MPVGVAFPEANMKLFRTRFGVKSMMALVAVCALLSWAWNFSRDSKPPYLYIRWLRTEAAPRRQYAVSELGRMGTEAEAAVPALLQSARLDEDPLVRALSIGSLRQILRKTSDRSATRAAGFVLIDALTDREPMVRCAAANSSTAEQFADDSKYTIPALLVCAQDRNEQVRMSALNALAWISPIQGADFVAVSAAIFKAMQDMNGSARERSLSAFRILARKSPTIIGAALSNENVRVRRAALEALRRDGYLFGIRSHTIAPNIKALLKDSDELVRLDTVNVLYASSSWSQGRPAVPKGWATRLTQNGTVGRGWLQASPAIPRALAATLKDASVDVRVAAASALGRFGASAAGELAALESALSDADPTVRRAAAESIRVIKAHSAEVTSAIEGWHEELTSRDAPVRFSAAEALGEMGVRAKIAIPALSRLLNDSDEIVVGAARKAINNITASASTSADGIHSSWEEPEGYAEPSRESQP
jgi:HEAT repeat protein